MNTKITLAALALGVCLASAPAFAQTSGCVSPAPLSPGGIGTAADSFGGPGPGYIGPVACPSGQGTLFNYVAPVTHGQVPAKGRLFNYVAPVTHGQVPAKGRLFNYVAPETSGQAPANTQLAPLSPGGIGTGADSFGGPGPGYIGPRQ